MTFETDFSDFAKLGVDLHETAAVAPGFLRKSVEVTSFKVKTAWNDKLYNFGHARRTRGTISYDVTVTRSTVEGEIGPYVTRVQSGIVKLLENGSINNPAHGYGGAALHENEGDFENGVRRAVEDTLKRAGL